MAVWQIGDRYRCNVCSDEVVVIKVGHGILSCCGKEMECLGKHQIKEQIKITKYIKTFLISVIVIYGVTVLSYDFGKLWGSVFVAVLLSLIFSIFIFCEEK